MVTQKFATVHVIEHPLIRARLTRLRSNATGTAEFRANLHQIAKLMIFDVLRDCATRETAVETPVSMTVGAELMRPVILVPILRAGLGMVHSMLEIVPEAQVGMVGMQRNETTFEPETYYNRMPSSLGEADVVIVDPMLATGNSVVCAATALKSQGAQRLRFLNLVSCPEGIQHMAKAHPDIRIFTAAIDDGLNDQAYIVPGLGDAGDRYFGTT
ncbi:MAG: uracil phosphoribosyltransferase [Verrucomicrobia bacterium]|nr:uracil phosphoribosyltransferase [Verrucomicrobiota bacterium]